MINRITKSVIKYFFKNNKRKDVVLQYVFRKLERDPLNFAYNNIGILNYENNKVSGEDLVIFKVLPKYISINEKSIFFDVGANIGEYSISLASIFSNSKIYSFEPNINTFDILRKNVESFNCIVPVNLGLSDTKKESEIFTYLNDLNSQHASLYKEVFNDLHKDKNSIPIKIGLESLDNICIKNNIENIDFLKIDTEGHEFDVLRGSIQMINKGRIKIIQFEFNEMNIISRVFLKDFYQILKDYKIYRLSEKRLIPIFHYDSTNEIFKFQNILAIHNTL